MIRGIIAHSTVSHHRLYRAGPKSCRTGQRHAETTVDVRTPLLVMNIHMQPCELEPPTATAELVGCVPQGRSALMRCMPELHIWPGLRSDTARSSVAFVVADLVSRPDSVTRLPCL